jgi:glycosyltransferase involved in cell wall biosynthesis
MMADAFVSVIIPAFNEGESLTRLTHRLVKTFTESHIKGEVIIVNDGSSDKTGVVADNLKEAIKCVRVLHHRRQLGKTAAIRTGFHSAKGDLIVIIDADEQYDPEEIPGLIAPLLNNHEDLVNGWRKNRRDPLTRILASRIYNWIVRLMFHTKVADNNSGLKAIRREVLETLMPQLRTNIHRYLIPLAEYYGFRVREIPVSHNPRVAGRSKYASLGRLITSPIDLLGLKIVLVFKDRPMILFGVSGVATFITGSGVAVYLLISKYLFGEMLTAHLPLLILSLLLIITGMLLFMLGFLASMIASLHAETEETLQKLR